MPYLHRKTIDSIICMKVNNYALSKGLIVIKIKICYAGCMPIEATVSFSVAEIDMCMTIIYLHPCVRQTTKVLLCKLILRLSLVFFGYIKYVLEH